MEVHNNIFLWKWEDREVDLYNTLRLQVEKIAKCGFSGILVCQGISRYKFTDNKVLRALSKTSQYAKKRNLEFIVMADPRQSSRFFISKTEERTQCLIIHRNTDKEKTAKFSNVAKVEEGHFFISIPFSEKYLCSHLQERAVLFSPSGVERVFLFRAENDIIAPDSVEDITALSYSITNIADGVIEISGDTTENNGGNYYVMAFPRFDTNLFDFAGRESNDLVYSFAGNIFDACTNLDGMIWGSDETSYGMIGDMLPVSLSIYNNFKAEYGYDLKNFLFALLLPMSDNSHIKVRTDFYTHLNNLIKASKKDFASTMHAFFPDFNLISMYSVSRGAGSDVKRCPVFDPWINNDIVSEHLTHLDLNARNNGEPDILSGMVISKSLAVFSESGSGAIEISGINNNRESLNFIADTASLFSLELILSSDNPEDFFRINKKTSEVDRITKRTAPFADTLFLFPSYTMMNINEEYRNYILDETLRLIKDLTLSHIQMDVISPHMLTNAEVSDRGIRLGYRTYKAVIAPYAEIVDSEIFHILSRIDDYKHPLLFGNSAPKYSTTGKKVPKKFSICFTIGENHIQEILSTSIKPAVIFPESCIGTIIFKRDSTLILVSPSAPGSKFEGRILFDGHQIQVEKSNSITIFQKMAGQDFTKIL
ncbi:hypothetical protein J7K93_07335 [bacterium]|nr:hypothetical protein [bacterium]